ncbi:MAG: helix-turn-helix domain-containing protein [Deltaproteobacteria bacterium]|nr:helix-turn-helix domain-containing protein [Deltaproteobacteria bacterium]MBW2136561.1 helix-turn-helix domain-containing protein [Deltaproteobacteria bacterium]
MKKFEELNFYEVLEVPFSASDFEIRQAYKEALSVYSEDSLVTYSFFTDEERERILKKIEEAFLTLIDDRKRGQYDKFLVDTGRVESDHFNNKGEKRSIPLFPVNKFRNKDVFLKRIKKKFQEADLTDLSEQILSRESISGKDIRALREAIGIDLEEVFEVTRISMPILDAIERDLVEKLPPVVYLKNFLRSYAQILHVDPEKISEGYIKNMSLLGEGTG